MASQNLMVVTLEEPRELSLEELCHACDVSNDFIETLIEYGVIDFQDVSVASRRFDIRYLHRIRTLLHLQHDLEVNIAGAALALELMDQIKSMETRLALLEKHLQM